MLAPTVGNGFTVTAVLAVLIQPFASVPETVYEAVAVGENATPLLTPLFQVYVLAPEPFRETVPFIQMALADELAPTGGKGFTVMVCTGLLVLMQPARLVPVKL